MPKTIDLKIEQKRRIKAIIKVHKSHAEKENHDLVVKDLYRLEVLGKPPSALFVYHRDATYPTEVFLDLEKIASQHYFLLKAFEEIDALAAIPEHVKTREYNFNCQKGNLEKVALYRGDFTEPGFNWKENRLGEKSGGRISLADYQRAFETFKKLQEELKSRYSQHNLLVKEKDQLRYFLKAFNKIKL